MRTLAEILFGEGEDMRGLVLLLPDRKLHPKDLLRWSRRRLAGADFYLVLYFRRDGISISAVRRPKDRACLCCRNFWRADGIEHDAVDDCWILEAQGARIVERMVALKIQAFRSGNTNQTHGVETDVGLRQGSIVDLKNHTFAAVMNCENCAPEPGGMNEGDLAELFLDQKFGLIERFSLLRDETMTEGDWPFVFVADGEIAGRRIVASGKDTNRDVAMGKTLSEFIERFVLVTSVYKGHTSKCLGELFTSHEEYVAFGGIEQATWTKLQGVSVRCLDLPNHGGTRDARALPAQLFFPIISEPRLFNVTSSGCAARLSLGEAIEDAVWEAIERDAFLRAWHHGEIEARVQTGRTDRFKQLLWKRERLTLDVYLLNAATGVVFLAIGRGDEHRSLVRFTCGLGAGRTPEAALQAALNELCQVVASLKARLEHPEGLARARALMSGETSVETASDHALRHVLDCKPWNESDFQILNLISDYEWPDYFCKILRTPTNDELPLGDRDLFVFPTQNTVARSYNYHVVKVLVPSLIQFYIGEKSLPLSLRGCRNPWPHPLA